MPEHEKRNYTRIRMRGKVVLTTGTDTPFILEGELDDICFAGFGAYFKQELPIGLVVSFKLTPENYQAYLDGKAEVRNLQQVSIYGSSYTRLGFQYTEVDKYMAVAFINAHQSQPKKTPGSLDPNWGPI